MPRIEANFTLHPDEWSLAECQEYLMGLAMPCPPAGTGPGGRCTTCDGTGKVYPLRERYGPSWHHQPCPTPDLCDCRGMSFIPVEPHLETLRAAALAAGWTHECIAGALRGDPSPYAHVFRDEARPETSEWVFGSNDLLTACRALCLALLAREASDE